MSGRTSGDLRTWLVNDVKVAENFVDGVVDICKAKKVKNRALMYDADFADEREEIYAALDEVSAMAGIAAKIKAFVEPRSIGKPDEAQDLSALAKTFDGDRSVRELLSHAVRKEGYSLPTPGKFFQEIVRAHMLRVDHRRKVIAHLMAVYRSSQTTEEEFLVDLEKHVMPYFQRTVELLEQEEKSKDDHERTKPACPTVALYTFKGGVGKTTTCVNVAAACAMQGLRVGVVDADTQGNTTAFYLAHYAPYPGNVIRTGFENVEQEDGQQRLPETVAKKKLLPMTKSDLKAELNKCKRSGEYQGLLSKSVIAKASGKSGTGAFSRDELITRLLKIYTKREAKRQQEQRDASDQKQAEICTCGQERELEANDLSFTGLWVCCDRCDRWLHFECVEPKAEDLSKAEAEALHESWQAKYSSQPFHCSACVQGLTQISPSETAAASNEVEPGDGVLTVPTDRAELGGKAQLEFEHRISQPDEVPNFRLSQNDNLPFLADKLFAMTDKGRYLQYSDLDETDDHFNMFPVTTDGIPTVHLLAGGPMRPNGPGFDRVEKAVQSSLDPENYASSEGIIVGSFRRLLAGLGRKNDLDIIFVDIGPSDTIMNNWMVMSCDFLIPPSFYDRASAQTVDAFIHHVYPTFRKKQEAWIRLAAYHLSNDQSGGVDQATIHEKHGRWVGHKAKHLFNPLTRVMPFLISTFSLRQEDITDQDGGGDNMYGIQELLRTALLSNGRLTRRTALQYIPYREHGTIKFDIRFIKSITALIMHSHREKTPIPCIRVPPPGRAQDFKYARQRFEGLAYLVKLAVCAPKLGNWMDGKALADWKDRKPLDPIYFNERDPYPRRLPFYSEKPFVIDEEKQQARGANNFNKLDICILMKAIRKAVAALLVSDGEDSDDVRVFPSASEVPLTPKLMEQLQVALESELTDANEGSRPEVNFECTPKCPARSGECIDIRISTFLRQENGETPQAGSYPSRVGIELKNETFDHFISPANFQKHFQQVDKYARAYAFEHIFLLNLGTRLGSEDGGPSGLEWQKIGSTAPGKGEELKNDELALALKQKTEFDEMEWFDFAVDKLRFDHFINVALTSSCSALAPGARLAAVDPFGDPLGLKPKLPSHASAHPPITALSRRPAVAAAAGALAATAAPAWAQTSFKSLQVDTTALDPASFQPVCPASDGFYRFGQTLLLGVVGPESYKEYAPLIAGGLLRVRLELCVVESFFYEAIIPFIKENGLSWVLPLHETVETFLAGTIFAVASNFILIGSTKLVTVIFTYADLFLGFPLRIVGGFGWRALEDKAIGIAAAEAPPEKPRPWWKGPKPREPPPIDEVWDAASKGGAAGKAQFVSWGFLLGAGQLTNGIRKLVEAADVFVGRYLLLTTVAYVGFKFVHFKIFDPFPM